MKVHVLLVHQYTGPIYTEHPQPSDIDTYGYTLLLHTLTEGMALGLHDSFRVGGVTNIFLWITGDSGQTVYTGEQYWRVPRDVSMTGHCPLWVILKVKGLN